MSEELDGKILDIKRINKHYDAVSLIENENNNVLDLLERLKELAMKLNKDVNDTELTNNMKVLGRTLTYKVIHLNRLEEEIIFPELEKVLPYPASTTAIRDEHKKISEILTKLQVLLEEKELNKTELTQSVILNLNSLIERDIHKKNEILFYEVQTMLPKEIQDGIYEKLKKKTEHL